MSREHTTWPTIETRPPTPSSLRTNSRRTSTRALRSLARSRTRAWLRWRALLWWLESCPLRPSCLASRPALRSSTLCLHPARIDVVSCTCQLVRARAVQTSNHRTSRASQLRICVHYVPGLVLAALFEHVACLGDLQLLCLGDRGGVCLDLLAYGTTWCQGRRWCRKFCDRTIIISVIFKQKGK